MSEIFRDIPGYEGLYQVSNLGRVKSLPREICNHQGCHISKEKILKQSINIYGYYIIRLIKYNKGKTFTVHQLVAITFLNHIPDGSKIVVDHINNDRLDNRLENLQIITARKNTSKDRKDGSSKYIGVSWDKSRNKWRSLIQINGKLKYLGRFNTELEASEYYQNALKSIENNEEIVIKKTIQTSNFRGVSWNKHSNKWVSRIYMNRKSIHIGLFNTELEAHNAYQNKLKETL